MEITKVKYLKEVVQIEYQEISQNGRMTKRSIKSFEIPMQSFVDSLVALMPVYKKILEKEDRQKVRITGVSIRYNEGEISNCLITGINLLEKRDKSSAQNTPYLFVEHSDDGSRLPDGTDKLLSEIIYQANLYINGNYAEQDLFENQETDQE